MTQEWKAALWSAGTTFLVTFALALSALGMDELNGGVLGAAAWGAAAAALRTLVAWINPGNTEYGVGAKP